MRAPAILPCERPSLTEMTEPEAEWALRAPETARRREGECEHMRSQDRLRRQVVQNPRDQARGFGFYTEHYRKAWRGKYTENFGLI